MLPFRRKCVRARQILRPSAPSFLLRSTLSWKAPTVKDYVRMYAIVTQETDSLHGVVDVSYRQYQLSRRDISTQISYLHVVFPVASSVGQVYVPR